MLGSVNGAKPAQVQQYASNAERYRKESDEISNEAKNLENESHFRGRQALRLHIGEIFLEIAIVFASLAILTKRPILYWNAVVRGLIGIVVSCTTAAVHG